MQYLKTLFAIAIMASITACTSSVTMQDISAQEKSARSELEEARKEMNKLAEMKEKYSVDSKEARIDELKDRKKTIRKDIKKLGGLESANLDSGKAAMVDGLKREQKEIEREIGTLEKIEKEQWDEAVKTINEKIDELSRQIDMITANVQ